MFNIDDGWNNPYLQWIIENYDSPVFRTLEKVAPYLAAISTGSRMGSDVSTLMSINTLNRIERYGAASGPTDLYTPEIQKYEASAFGTTRII